MKCNENLRKLARAENVPLWKIALELSVSEPTVIRWLRTPLSPEREAAMLAAIRKLSKEAL